MNRKRTYLDPIHQDVILDREKPEENLIIDLIDAREFQRLRRIQQLGLSSFTFHGAEGSRFTHSLGVMHIASRLISLLAEKTPAALEQKALVLASGLLHDIGHGPYSHVTEKILGYDHENWSCRIISENTEIHEILDRYSQQYDRNSDLSAKIVQVLKKQYKPKYISYMVSSQLDCDRFDYLLRDSYMTGTSYGLFALQRVLSSMEIDQANDCIVVVGEKGQGAVEDYLFARYSMYAQVYYHKKNLAARGLLAKLIERAKYVMKELKPDTMFIDDVTAKWLSGKVLSVDEYLLLDDVQITYHIKRWIQSGDKILSDLAARFLNRRLFKAKRIPSNDQNFINDVEQQAKKLAAQFGLDPDYYVTTEGTDFRPYDYYRPDSDIPQTNIMVLIDTGKICELSQLSLTIEALVKSKYESHWLIFPDELYDSLGSIKELATVH
jgi:HD superfamily phosphohydrolase